MASNSLYVRPCLGKNHQPDQHWISWSILFTCCHLFQSSKTWGKTGRQQLHSCWTKFPDSLCIYTSMYIYIYINIFILTYKQPFKLRCFSPLWNRNIRDRSRHPVGFVVSPCQVKRIFKNLRQRLGYRPCNLSALVATDGGPRADRFINGVKWGPYKWP